MSGADYMIRGLGYVHSISDLEQISVATNSAPLHHQTDQNIYYLIR